MSLTLSEDTLQLMAIQAIRGYKNFPFDISDDEINSRYSLAITLIIQNIKDYLNVNKFIAEEDLGDRDITYRENIKWIDNSIITLIGHPYVKFL